MEGSIIAKGIDYDSYGVDWPFFDFEIAGYRIGSDKLASEKYQIELVNWFYIIKEVGEFHMIELAFTESAEPGEYSASLVTNIRNYTLTDLEVPQLPVFTVTVNLVNDCNFKMPVPTNFDKEIFQTVMDEHDSTKDFISLYDFFGD